MKSYRKALLITALFASSFVAFSQEICDNGIDDDGNGLIDCFDGSCADDGACDDFFFGNSVVCFDEVDVTSFAIRQQWGSANETATSHASPAVGDLDQDGIPEVVTVNNYGDMVYVLSGFNGSTLASAPVGFDPENTPAIANVDGDEFAEILVTQNEGKRIKLFSYDLATEIWSVQATNNDMGIAGFADFNEDGVAEVYYKNEIINAVTGAKLVTGSGDWERDYLHGPIAIDIYEAGDPVCTAAGGDCQGLELVTGNEVWAVDLAGGNLVLLKDMNDLFAGPDIYRPLYWGSWLDGTRSMASAADYNLDGNIDVLLTGAFGTTGESSTDEVSIFMWDVVNDNVLRYHDNSNNFRRGPGRVNIGDVDGDGQMNANFVMDQFLYSLDENFGIHWKRGIKEGSSGFTGCTLFDFDGDGTVETVYRSEESVLIIDGVDGSDRNEFPCVSRTQEEYPVVADIDGDGASEICVACYFNDATPFNPYSNTQFSHIRVYESDGEAWMPARSVWNQHGYFNVNVNDDLTIPEELQDHTLVFSDGLCEYSDGSIIPFPSRPLNNFLVQAPILDENGCVEFVSPDLILLGNDISATPAVCPEAEIDVTFDISNEGDTDISGGLPISYYAGDPTVAGSQYLDTEVIILNNFDVGETLEITHTIQGVGGEYQLYIVANDLGGTPPIAASLDELPNSVIPECETGNNYNIVDITFDPFTVDVEKLNDDRRCDLTLTPNGSARAFYFGPTPIEEETIWLENFEDLTNGDNSDAGTTGWSSDPGSQSPNFYGVSSYNGSKMFRATGTGTANGVGEVSWTSERIDISDHTDVDVTIDVFENGNQEGSSSQWWDYVRIEYEIYDNDEVLTASGQFPTNGLLDDDFTYNQASLLGLNASGTDSLLVIMAYFHNTSSSENHFIDNVFVSGFTIPEVKEHDESDGFAFNWYAAGDYSTILHTGSTYPQMAGGNYEVIATYSTTMCGSDTMAVEILNLNATSTPPYEVRTWIYEVSPLDNCDIPNGSLSAFVYTTLLDEMQPASETNPPQDTLRTADGYQLEWRITNDATNTIIGTGDQLNNLTNQSYTVDVTEIFSGCTASAALTVSSGLSFPPDPNVNVVNIVACGGTGTLTADVNGNTSDYTFEWFDGPGVKPVADATGDTYIVNEPGEYTVRATEITSSCPSNPVTALMVDDSSAPVASASVFDNNSSCVSGNGIITADGDGAGTVTGFTFSWFKGANTLPGNALPGTAEPNSFLVSDNPFELGGLTGGTYRVVVIEDATMCSDTLDLLVQDVPTDVNTTPGDLIINDIISCDLGILGSIDASGVVDGDVNDVSIGNLNTSFEELDILSTSIHEQSFDGGNIKTFDQEDINGWSTTATDDRIEIWHSNNTIDGGIHNAFDGDQFAEINANQTAALYFDLSTTPGALFSWSFAHKGRAGNDEISVNIGAAGAEVVQGTFITGNLAWSEYSGIYTVPDGQFTTRFQFEAVSTASGNNSVGNFVDDITFVLFPYRFELYEGTSTSGTADYINTDGVFTDLDDGDYVLVVYDNLTGCDATEIPFTLDRNTDEPEISATVDPSNNCDAGNGSIVVTSQMPITSVEPTSGYTYQLFDGHSFSSQNGSDVAVADGSVGHTFSNLDAGDYRINIINVDAECSAFEDVVINDASIKPSMSTSVTKVDNTSCDPVNPNGFIAVNITGDPSSDYFFTWYDGDDPDTDPVILSGVAGQDFLDASIHQVDAGFYTVFAENITTGCETDTLTIEVFNDPYIPNVVIVEEQDHTFCSSGNGSLRAYVTNDPTGVCTSGCELDEADGFSFQWQYMGADMTNGVDPGNGSLPTNVATSTVGGLIGDEYSVIVTYDDLDCSATESEFVTTNQINPILTFDSRTPNTVCDDTSTPFTGSITVTSTYDGVDFTADANADYDWFMGPDLTGTPMTGDANTLANLEDTLYTVQVVNTLTGCPSTTLTIEVLFTPDNPVISLINEVPNTVCDPALADDSGNQFTGSIEADVTGGSGTYSYQWFTGSTATPGNEVGGATAAVLSNVEHGFYTVEVTDDVNGCVVTSTEEIDDGRTAVDLQEADINIGNVDVCVGATNYPNGSLTVTLVDAQADFTDYSFNWYFGSGTGNTLDQTDIAGSSLAGLGTNAVTGLEAGDYTVEAVNDVTGCVSVTRTLTVDDVPITINAAETIQHYTNCASPNASIDVVASMASGGEPASYTFDWFFGSGTVEPLDGTDLVDDTNFGIVNTGTNQTTASGLEDGTYTLRITNDDTECSNTYEYDIENNQITPVIDEVALAAGVTNNTVCDPAEADGNGNDYNGVIDPQAAVTPTVGGGTSYTFRLFDDTDTEMPVISPTTTTFTQVPPGNYTVTAEITSPANGGVGCVSAAAAVTVGDNLTLPDFDLTPTPDTYCNADNGSISIDFTGTVPPDGFEIEVFTDAGATISQEFIGAAITDFSTPPTTASNLTTGTYHVRFINNTTGCSAIESSFVDEVFDAPVINTGTTVSTADENCVGDNGTITVIATNVGTDPLYSLYAGSDASGVPITTQTSNVFTSLAQGTYTVTVTKNDVGESGCESTGFTLDVNETLDVVTTTATVVNQQSSCDANNPNGRITSVASGTVSGATNFTFTYYQGATTDPAFEVTAVIPTAVLSGTGDSQVDGLPAGIYTVEAVNDQGGSPTGCSDTDQVTIGTVQTAPQITLTSTLTDNDACSAPFTGSIRVSADDNGSTEPLDGANGYTFELYAGSTIGPLETPLQTLDESDASVDFTGLENGNYMVRAIDNNTSCEIDTSVPIVVGDIRPQPDVTEAAIAIDPPTNCFANSGEIDLSAAVSVLNTTGSDNITVTWYEGFDIGGSAVQITATETLADDNDNITGIVVGPVAIAGGTLTNYRIQDVPAINYSAILTNDVSGCSDTIFVNIPETNAPVVVTTPPVAPTNCAASNGSITFDITTTNPDVASNYKYTLYSGFENIPPDADAATPYNPTLGAGIIPITAIPDLNGTAFTENVTVSSTLDAGDYTLVIIRDADECPVYSENFTLDNPELPLIANPPLADVVDNTNCGDGLDGGVEYNGSITVSATYGGAQDDFTFAWYTVDESGPTYTAIANGATAVDGDDDFDVTITLNPNADGFDDDSEISGIGELSTAGLRFAVIATHTATSCVDTLHVDLFNDPTPIAISGVVTDIDDCTPGDPGGFTVNSFSPGAVGDYTFQWWNGTMLVVDDADKLDYTTAGDYYVIATNTNNGCSQQLDFTIEDVTEDPKIELVTLNDNSNCAGGPLSLGPNGSIQIQIGDGLGGTLPAGNYLYQWYFGALGSGNTLDAADLIDPSNLAGTNSNTVSGLEAGTYYVEVEDNSGTSFDCVSSDEFVIEDDLDDIEVQQLLGTDYTIGHQTFCNPSENGIVTMVNVYVNGVAQDAATGNFDFVWYDDDMGTAISVGTIAGANNHIAQDLPSGTYYVEAVNEDDDCVSELVSFTIDDDRVLPLVQVEQLVRDSICTANVGSGSILASVILSGGGTDAVGEYTFEWYQGVGNAGDANFSLSGPGGSVTATGYSFEAGSNGSQVNDLPDDVYEVVVTNNAGGSDGDDCFTTESITVDQFTPVISILTSDITINPNENCAPGPNGSAEVTRVQISSVDGGTYFIDNTDPEWANFTWEWYDVATGGAVQDTDETYSNLGLGDETYYVIITDWSDNGCAMTGRKEVIVPDDIPSIELTITQDSPDEFCSPVNEGNGQITVDIEVDGSTEDPAHYTIEWFVGSGTGTTLGASGLVGFTLNNNDATLTDVPNGIYTVRVTKDGGGATAPALNCISAEAVFDEIESDEPEITLISGDFGTTANTVCDRVVAGAHNGTITITDVTVDGASAGTAGFDFAWTGEGGVVITTQAPDASGNTGTNITGLVGGIYEVTITDNPGTGCVSEVIQVEVLNTFTLPTLTLNGTANNTHCDGAATFTGSVDVTAGTTAGPFTFAWHDGQNPVGGTTGTVGGVAPNSTLSNLDGGFYTVVATDQGTGCTVTETYFVPEVLDIPELDEDAVQANTEPDTLCVGLSGRLLITDADFLTGDIDDYNITITGALTGAVAGPFTSPQIDLTGLEPDDYTITALNATTNCAIATAVINVKDSVRNPQIGIVNVTPDQDCGISEMAGGLEIIIDELYDESAPRFTVQWYTGTGAVGGNEIAGANSVVLSNQSAGPYSVLVTNTNTNCSSTLDFTIPNDPINPSIFDYTVVNNSVCDDDMDNNPLDNGSYELIEAVFDGTVLNQAAMTGNYTLEIYELPGLAPVADNDGASPFLFEELSAGDYRAVVVRDATLCSSNGVDFTIEDDVNRPTITIVMQEADSSCVGGTANGTLFATVNGGIQDTDPDYDFQWYVGSGTGGATLGTTSTETGLAAGTYTVEVTFIPTGCTSTDEFEVPNVPVEIEILAADVTDAIGCNGDASLITVTSVTRDTPADYNFDYYDVDPTVGSPAPVFTGAAGASLANAAPGVYYIIGTHISLNCTTGPFEIEIGEDFEYPEIVLDDFDFQTNCDPSNPNGSLTITSDGVTPSAPTYNVTWYFGTGTGDLLDDADIGGNGTLTGENTATVGGLPAGFSYTVEVENTTTGCISTETYEMADDIPNPLLLSTTSSANTSCTDPNGQLAATVIIMPEGRGPSDFVYYWYQGDQTIIDPLASDPLNPSPAPFATGSLIDSLEAGIYTVFVVDLIDNFCQSTGTLVEVEDGTSPPDYELNIVNEVTVCFDDKDGFAEVSVPDVSQVTIEWQFIDNGDQVVSTQLFADSLDAGNYRVVITDINTGCFANPTFVINNNAVIPPDPTVILNANRTNCAEANANAVANVDGVQNGYLFEWFAEDDMTTPYATGAEVFNLDSTTYLVRATDLATGCESALTSITVEYDITDPVFEVQFSVATCLRTEDGAFNQFDGTAIVAFEEFNFAQEYRWENERGELVGNQSRVIDLPPGTYTVYFTADNGCEYTETFNMTTELTVYNGLSANADGLNDFFLIDCVDYFPNNNVMIFNRDGVKVFEIDSYNNVENRFEGFSNVGNSKQLPSGTYYYVIDRGDGTDPRQGFLELVR